MNARTLLALGGTFVLAAGTLPAAAPRTDILPTVRRQVTVDLATRLANRPPPAPFPANVTNPFAPPGFDEPDPVPEVKPPPVPGGAGQPVGEPSGPPPPPTDRTVLESLAVGLKPSGTFVMNGKPFLLIDRNRFEVGTKFIVSFNNQDYELELVTIDRTTFTLRYRGEEITRPIKPVR
jgi:hypothetical protein